MNDWMASIRDAFHRTPRMECDIFFGGPIDKRSSPNECMNNLEVVPKTVHAFARERNKLSSEQMKTAYDSRATDHHFKEGDQV
ncbi:hypothetical protein AVEN_44047-1 [Araneus ventricosus]|uniref:Uncharacterized protein n=1 Tax=Araneus ventricosus TaxID=182803 RepID=A0A4Y2HAW9_ARAVE|nr:hypothetical protein AVEN_44047-1 [Araneus ventricosus]